MAVKHELVEGDYGFYPLAALLNFYSALFKNWLTDVHFKN
ncbi:hypothetical protein AVEN_42266-1, partial [Araneus ventricosus]